MAEEPTFTEQTFASEPMSIRSARKFVTALAAESAGMSARLPDIELATSELATNAVEHGLGAEFQVRVAQSSRMFSVEVISATAGDLPHIRIPEPTDLTGRGLRIASHLSNLTVDRIGARVVVTCTFPRSAPQNPAGFA